MDALARGPRMVAALFIATTLLLGLALAAPAGAGPRHKLLRMVNAARERHDLRPLRVDRSLARTAVGYTRRMIRRDQLADPPNLARMLRNEPWDRMGGSVVGCGSSVRAVHRAFMRHREHRVIILNKKLRRIGIGVRQVDRANSCGESWFWVTELFYG